MSSSERYLRVSPLRPYWFQGVAQSHFPNSTSVPEVNWEGDSRLVQRRGRDLAGARQETAKQAPPDKGFVHFHDRSHNVTRDNNDTQSHNIHKLEL